MHRISFLIGALLLVGAYSNSSAQPTFQVGFWNIENLFDTTDASATRDDDFTPQGRYEWTEKRLSKKCADLTRVIHEIDINNDLAILGLAEIENFQVLNRLNSDYIKRGWDVVHKESPDERGIDCGLLFNPELVQLVGKKFHTVFLAGDDKTRDIIEAEFKLNAGSNQSPLYVFVNHWPSRWGGQEATDPLRRSAAQTLRIRVDQILGKDPQADIIIMGDFNDYPTDPSIQQVLRAHGLNPNAYPGDLINTTWKLHQEPNKGTYMYRGKWGVLDQIIVSQGMVDKQDFDWVFDSTHPFAEDYLFVTEGKYAGWPFRLFAGGKYHGGYSDHLPILCNIVFTSN